MPLKVYVSVGNSSHHQSIASLALVWGFLPLKAKFCDQRISLNYLISAQQRQNWKFT